ncbi:hypothetical protein Tco_0268950 [Tanacetum coccineum]
MPSVVRLLSVPASSTYGEMTFSAPPPLTHSRMSNTSDKGTMFGDGAARVGMQLRSSPKIAQRRIDSYSNWLNLHDVHIQVFEEMVNSETARGCCLLLVIPSLSKGYFTKKPSVLSMKWRPPRCDTCKEEDESAQEGNYLCGLYSQSTPMSEDESKKDNLSMSNSFSTLNEEEEEDEEDVKNVYDESANLIQNTKAGGNSSFTAAAG